MHDLHLLSSVAVSMAAALVFGFITHRIGLSPIVGYLVAGILVGPHTPGFEADQHVASQLAEVGVVLLMFGVGLHFHPKDLLAVRGIAVPGAIGQIGLATALGAALCIGMGWTIGAGVLLGIGVSVASTVVLMRGLQSHGMLTTVHGHIAVGWLIVEDVFTVLVLVLIPSIGAAIENGGSSGIAREAVFAFLKLALLVALLLGLGRKALPTFLSWIAKTRSRELFTLSVLALALGIASLSAVAFGASMALGAFLAGMVVGHSGLGHQAAADALPMRDAFAVLFFVSVGMLFDPKFLLAEPLLTAGVLAIVLIGKPLAAIAIVALLGYSLRTALIVAVGLAQIGEFSFILADAAVAQKLLPETGRSVLIASALVSIALNPLAFRAIPAIERRIDAIPALRDAFHRRAERRANALNRLTSEHLEKLEGEHGAVVVGYGPVGSTAARILREFGIRPVIIDLNVDTVSKLAAEGHPAIYGDAGQPDILRAAGIEKARYLLITLPHAENRMPVLTAARELNRDLRILVRARYVRERDELGKMGPTAVCYEEAEAAVAIASMLLKEIGAEEERIEAETERVRKELDSEGRVNRA